MNVGTSRLARPRIAPAIRTAATVCPVGVWCGAPTLRLRPDRTSIERSRGGHWEERGRRRGRGGAAAEKEEKTGRARREWGRGKKTPQGKATPHPSLRGQ